MQTTNEDLRTGHKDAEWYFLGEYHLEDFLANEELRDPHEDGTLVATIRDLGIEPELLNNIERKLIEFAKGTMAQYKQGRYEIPAYIRLFCKRKTIENINSLKSSGRINAGQAKKPALIIHQPDSEICGGWGYFLVESNGTFPPISSKNKSKHVDIYLYKEGL